MNTDDLSLDKIERLITTLVKAGSDAFVQGLIDRVPPTAIKHGRVTLGMIRHLLDQTGGHTNLPEEILAQINRPEEVAALVPELLIDCGELPAYYKTAVHNSHTYPVSQHHPSGKVIWRPDLFQLYFTPAQLKGQPVTGETIYRRVRLVAKDIPNVCVLKWLLEHQQYIPVDWQQYQIGFFGTTYKSDGAFYGHTIPQVFWLQYSSGRWDKVLKSLGRSVEHKHPAIMYATPSSRR